MGQQQQQIHAPSQGAKYALYYITAGALVLIWSAIWFYYLRDSGTPWGDSRYYICTGLLLSGFAVLTIGILVGRIGKEGKSADVPMGTITAAAIAPGAQPANGAATMPVAPAPVAPAPVAATIPPQPAPPATATLPRR